MRFADAVAGKSVSELREKDEAEDDKHGARNLVDPPQPVLGQLVAHAAR